MLDLKDTFLTLGCANLEATVNFYQTLLQQPPAPYLPQRYAEFHLPGMRLALFSPSADHQEQFSGGSSGAMSLCLEVGTLEVAIAHLTHMGYPPSPIITASHGREVYSYDPEGNRLIWHESR